jgi:hypothetical protein
MSIDYANHTTVSDDEPRECLDLVRHMLGGTASVRLITQVSEECQSANEVVRQPPEKIIGVECGPPSEGLCAILFPDKERIDDFITDNPDFGTSMITFWPKSPSYCLWVRSDWLPPNTSLDGISLVSKGVVPVAVPGMDLGQFVARQGPIPILSFAKIKWSLGLTDRFRIILLQQAFGPPHRLSGSGKVVVNKMFWGHLLAEKLGLIYHVRRQTFLRRKQEGQVPEPIGSDDLMRLMLCEIQNIASQDLPDFPLDALGLATLKRILEVLKIVAGVNTPGEQEDFLAFLEEHAIKQKGTGLTVSELYQGYAKARPAPYPEDVFQKLIPELVYQRFGLRKSHDFVRVDDDGTRHCPRGFHGLAWKTAG